MTGRAAAAIAAWYGHKATFELVAGYGPRGRTMRPPIVGVPCYVDMTRTVTRGPAGDTVVSTARVYTPLGARGTDGQELPLPTGPDAGAAVVTLGAPFGGVRLTVQGSHVHHGAGMDTPDHVEWVL